MLSSDWIDVSELVSLGVIAAILAVTIAASLLLPAAAKNEDAVQ
jgi:hypothetical protein